MQKRKVRMIIIIAALAVCLALAALLICRACMRNSTKLKTVYTYRFDFGCAVDGGLLSDPEKEELVTEQFNIITLENELKPDSVLDLTKSQICVAETGDQTAVEVHFDRAEPLLDFAVRNKLKVHGHALLWYRQTPEEFFHEDYLKEKPFASREIMLGRMENYIKAVMTYLSDKYPGLIVSWDVVNEATGDEGLRLREGFWLQVVGEDYVLRAFEFARKYAPEGMLLYYNDYDTALPEKQGVILELLKSLISEGNIDGYGFQMHIAVDDPDVEQIRAAFDTFSALGLHLRVSEMDIAIDDCSKESLEAQAEMYAKVMKVLIEHSNQIDAVQVWGLTDEVSWISDKYPLLFDKNGNPKPAFWACRAPDSFLRDRRDSSAHASPGNALAPAVP